MPQDNQEKVIIFDLGNVLIDFDHTIAAKRIMHFCDKTSDEIFGLFFSSGVTTLFEEGKISPKDFFIKVKEMIGLRLEFENFLPIWNEIFFYSHKNRMTFKLASELRRRYKIAILTNINQLHYEYLKKHFPIFRIFDHVFTSFELGLSKPDPMIYKKVLGILNIGPEQAFYTDDRPELVESASNLGINSLCFRGAQAVGQWLHEKGVVIS